MRSHISGSGSNGVFRSYVFIQIVVPDNGFVSAQEVRNGGKRVVATVGICGKAKNLTRGQVLISKVSLPY